MVTTVLNPINNRFASKKSIIAAIYKLLDSAKVEGRYFDDNWVAISKLKSVLDSTDIDYTFECEYVHDKYSNTALPNSKKYIFEITAIDKHGKDIMIYLHVNLAFVGDTGTMSDDTYEMTYCFGI